MENKEAFMELAYTEALKAKAEDEVPVGAILVYQGEVIAKGYNQRNKQQQSIAHAEIMTIQEACQKMGSWRLEECDLYVTLEPCPMCAGAIIQSRIKNVYFGAKDPKGGCFGSVLNMMDVQGFNHYPHVESGILEEKCSLILSEFFKEKRKNK